jgi:hypothetical protein
MDVRTQLGTLNPYKKAQPPEEPINAEDLKFKPRLNSPSAPSRQICGIEIRVRER